MCYGSAQMETLKLRPGRVQPVWAGHPWVYAQAIEPTDTTPESGAEVRVVDAKGNFLGRGLYTEGSAIPVRLFTRRDRCIDADLFRNKVAAAIELRRTEGLPGPETNAYRVIHGEGDGLPGLVVDRFGDTLAVQLGTAGLWQRRDLVLSVIDELLAPRHIYDRTPQKTASMEGFLLEASERDYPLIKGEQAPLHFTELGLRYEVPYELQQKTGFYVDQRPLRQFVASRSEGKRVLDAYGYIGAIGLNAAKAKATSVLSVDRSSAATEVANTCAKVNAVSGSFEAVTGDVFERCRELAAGSFDISIFDPPKLAPRKHNRQAAMKLLRRLSAEAVKLTVPGGMAIVSSCSSAIGPAELARCLALGALDRGKHVQVLARVFQGADHPVPAAFSEGAYLCTLACRVTERV